MERPSKYRESMRVCVCVEPFIWCLEDSRGSPIALFIICLALPPSPSPSPSTVLLALVEFTKRIRQKDSPSIDRTSLHISHWKRVWICVWSLKFKYMPQIPLAVTHRGCQISWNDKFSISMSFSHNIFLNCTPLVIIQQHDEKLDNVLSLHTDVGGLLQKQEKLL